MSLQDISAYLVGLFRNGPEVCAAFVVGIISSMLLMASLRRWFSQDQDLRQELVRKELELARKEAELARKDDQLRSQSRSEAETRLSLELIPPCVRLFPRPE
jgi:nitrogen fixation/metabolism regulation signal transduction histidine kinase